MNIFPPILTNRYPAQTSSYLLDPKAQQDGNQSKNAQLGSNLSSFQKETSGTSSLQKEDEVNPNRFFFKYIMQNPHEEINEDEIHSPCLSSEQSDYVENDWSPFANNDTNRQQSKEAQEAELQNKYQEGINYLNGGNFERATSIFTSILTHPIMQKYHVTNWEAFDKGELIEPHKIASNMAKIYFNVNLFMACIAETPTPFYIQALIIHEDPTLWSICAKTAIEKHDWRTSQYCFVSNINEFQTLEALLIVQYLNQDFLQCTSILCKLFRINDEYELGHIIRANIAEINPFWRKLHEKCYTDKILNYLPAECNKEKFRNTIRNFEERKFSTDSLNGFNIFKKANNGDFHLGFAPLRVKLNIGLKMEELGNLLCDIFTRIEHFSSFVEQKILFEFGALKKTDKNTIGNTLAKNIDQDLEMLQENRAAMPEIEEDLMGRLLEQITANQITIDQITTTHQNLHFQFADVPTEIVQKERIDIDKDNEQQASLIQTEEGNEVIDTASQEEGTDNNAISMNIEQRDKRQKVYKTRRKFDSLKEKENTEESTDEGLRRSNRLNDDQQSGLTASTTRYVINDGDEWDVLRMMGLQNETNEYDAISNKIKQNSQFNLDIIQSRELVVDPLIIQFEKAGALGRTNFCKCIYEFLAWIAIEQFNGVTLTVAQAEIYRQLYIHWSSTLIDPFNSLFFNQSYIQIHQLAAELGSHRALSLLQSYYGNGNVITELSEELGTYQNREKEGGKEMNKHQEYLPCIGDSFESPIFLLERISNQIILEQHHNNMSEHQNDIKFIDNETKPCHTFPIDLKSNRTKDEVTAEIRYRWLIANLQSDELGLSTSFPVNFAHSYYHLKRALHIIKPEWKIWSQANFGLNCLSKHNLEHILQNKVQSYLSRQIDYLVEMKRYVELKDIFIHYYEWEGPNDDTHVNNMFLLIKCFQETEEPWEMTIEWIIRILSLLTERKVVGIQAKRLLRRCFTILDGIDNQFHNVNQSIIKKLGRFLGLLANPDHYPYLIRSIDLWIWCHRIAKYLEGKLNPNYLHDLYDHFGSEGGPNKILPTKALLILSKAHEILGKSRKCWKKEGQFLRLLLNEFTHVLNDTEMKYILSNPNYEDIRENAIIEINQCIHCLFSAKFHNQPKAGRSRYIDHGSKLQFETDWDLALRVLPLLTPTQLPEMSSDTRVSPELIDMTTKVFECFLQIERTQLERMENFCNNPPYFELVELIDTDGLWCGYEEKLELSEEGQKRLKELAEAKASHEKTDNIKIENEKAELKAKMFYLLAHYHNRSGNSDSASEYLRKCLSIGHSHLSTEILSSAWYTYGQTRTNTYTSLSDNELFERMDECLLPFKMAIYLNWEFPEAHLDIGELMYQLRTRLMRFNKQTNAKMESAEHKEKSRSILQKMEGILQKARLHFRMAQRHNIDAIKDIAWLTNYFLAKISEKLGEPVSTIFDLYYKSALDLEHDGVQYLPKINRTKQTYLEPVEIHYKVHSFAMRRLKCLKNIGFTSSTIYANEVELILAYLQIFKYHGVQQRSDCGKSADGFYDDWKIKEQIRKLKKNELNLQDELECLDEINRIEIEVQDQVKKLVSSVDYAQEIEHLCVIAFEKILQRFPHYKAAYRLAEYAFKYDKNYKKTTNILFEKLFMVGKKQRPNNFFENVVEIKRTDFERNGSFPYHLYKIIKLAANVSKSNKDITYLKDLIIALTFYKTTTSSREALNDEEIVNLMDLCYRSFNKLVAKSVQEDGQNSEKLSKLIQHIEEVLQRLKRDKRSSFTEMESLLIVCVRRRDQLTSMVEDDDIVLLDEPTQLSETQQTIRNSTKQQQQLKDEATGKKQHQKRKAVTPIRTSGFAEIQGSSQQQSQKMIATQLNLIELAKQLQKQQSTGANKLTQSQLQQLQQKCLNAVQLQKQQIIVGNSKMAKRPYSQQEEQSSSNKLPTSSTICQPPPEKKKKRIDEEAINILAKAQGLKKLDSFSNEQRNNILKMFFEKLNYEYNNEDFVQALYQFSIKQRKQIVQTSGSEHRSNVPITSVPSPPLLNSTASTSQSQLVKLTNKSSMPDRMIGLSPATKIRYQQQTNSQKSSTTIQSESTKPAIAIIRPSMNTQTHHHPQQPQQHIVRGPTNSATSRPQNINAMSNIRQFNQPSSSSLAQHAPGNIWPLQAAFSQATSSTSLADRITSLPPQPQQYAQSSSASSSTSNLSSLNSMLLSNSFDLQQLSRYIGTFPPALLSNFTPQLPTSNHNQLVEQLLQIQHMEEIRKIYERFGMKPPANGGNDGSSNGRTG